MSRRGENIYKRKDNRWEGRYIKGYDCSGKAMFGYIYARSYRDARQKLSECKRDAAAGSARNKRDFGKFCDEWLILSRSRVKDSTYVKYHTIIKKHIEPKFGDMLPQMLNTVIIEEFSHGLLTEGMSVKTVKDILTVLRSVLKYCRSQLSSSFPDIEIIYPKERNREMRVLTLDEQETLVQYLTSDTDSIKFGILLALLTGMRIGEICALKWSSISLDEKTVHVCATMQRLKTFEQGTEKKTKVIVGDTKSETSDRVIPLSDFALSLCLKMKPESEDAYVLTGDAERFMEPRAVQYRLGKYTAECGLDGVHFHALRHTFATRCVEVGFEIKSLSEILGHSSTKVTLDRYVHSSLELKRSNMDKLSAIGM